MTFRIPVVRIYCARSLLSPTVLERSAHPAGSRSLLSKTKSFIVPFLFGWPKFPDTVYLRDQDRSIVGFGQQGIAHRVRNLSGTLMKSG